MVATVQITERNGTPTDGTGTVKTSSTLRFKKADNATVDTSNPMVIPTADQDWSFQKWTRLNVTVKADTNITNLVFYTDGTGWSAANSGVKGYVAAETTYATPILASGSSQFTNDMFSYTSSGSLDLGTSATTTSGLIGDHAHMGLEVETGSTQGTLPAETLTYAYDEL